MRSASVCGPSDSSDRIDGPSRTGCVQCGFWGAGLVHGGPGFPHRALFISPWTSGRVSARLLPRLAAASPPIASVSRWGRTTAYFHVFRRHRSSRSKIPNRESALLINVYRKPSAARNPNRTAESGRSLCIFEFTRHSYDLSLVIYIKTIVKINYSKINL